MLLMQKAAKALPSCDGYCEPIPDVQAFLVGIPHRNARADYAGELWHVVAALASKKVHYKARLKEAVFDKNGNADWGNPFHDAYPNAVLDNGWTALTAEAFVAANEAAGIPTDVAYVNHILEKHNGEVRHWGPRWWKEVPDDFVPKLRSVAF